MVSVPQSSVTVTWGAVTGTPFPVLVVDALTADVISPSFGAPVWRFEESEEELAYG